VQKIRQKFGATKKLLALMYLDRNGLFPKFGEIF